jgi:ribonuclease P protein component
MYDFSCRTFLDALVRIYTMFKKSERLTVAEFDQFFKTGQRHHSPLATIVTDSHNELKTSVVVGKKILKSAARRNTVRRRVYALLREVVEESGYQGVVIVMVKKPLITFGRKQAAAELKEKIALALKSA